MTIVMAAIILFGMTLVFATLLGVAKEKLKVEEDPRIEQINEVLPAANCGGCGYAGCSDFAKAVVEGRAPCDGCPVGGADCATQVASVMGIEVTQTAPYKVIIKCGAKTTDKLGVVEYDGIETCVAAAAVGVTQACAYGCVGYGDCVRACTFDALHMIDGKPVVHYDNCTGCGACVEACPRDLIEKIPFKQERMLVIACNNRESAKAVKAVCKVGCVGCKICAKFAPDVFEMSGNIAGVNYEKYDGQETDEVRKALDKCPAEIMIYMGKPAPEPAPESASELVSEPAQ